MKTIWLMIIGALTVTFSLHAQYSFITLDPPGSTTTEAYGIDGNNIVGYYIDSSGVHGFIYNGTGYTTLNVPGAVKTYAAGISGGTIVGYCQVPSGYYYGFIYAGGSYTTNLSYASGTDTYFTGINGTEIVGYYNTGSFTYTNSSYTNLTVPGSQTTVALGIATTGVVGYYRANTGNPQDQGFFYDGNSYTTVDYPAALLTLACGLENNSVVGWYIDTTNYNTHGFLYNGAYSSIDFPGVSITYAYSISGGEIVGSYQTNGVTHGLWAIPAVSPVQLQINRSGANLLLRWTNNVAGYALQSSTNLSAAGIWSSLVTNPSVLNGEYVYTNRATGTAVFFRLKK
jgi:hypothetical protein